MSQPLEQPRRYTIAEYLALEAAALDKHEYHDGEILAMSGGTYSHSLVTANTIIALGARLRGTPCRPLESNMRFRINRRNRYVYPDVTVVCGPPEFDPNDRNQTTLLNPRAVFEVLSESTQGYDRGDKFDAYRAVPALQEYVIVAQDRPAVETFNRQTDGSWRLDAYAGIETIVRLRSLEIDLPMSELYLGVTFPPAEQAAPATP